MKVGMGRACSKHRGFKSRSSGL